MKSSFARQPGQTIPVLVLLLATLIQSAIADDVALTPDGKVDKSYILSGADQEHQSPTTNWVFLILQPLLWACCCVAAYVQQKRRSALISTRNVMIERRRQQRQGEEEEDFDEDARLELVISKFHVRKVSSAETTVNEEGEDEENPKEKDKKDDVLMHKEQTEDNDDDSASEVSQRLSSIWNSIDKAECSICLEGYCKSEQVCVSKNPDCSHMFHQECIAEWLKRHDKCPLCRVDLIK